MNKSCNQLLGGSPGFSRVRSRCLALLYVAFIGGVAQVYAQNARSIIEKVPTFLEYQLQKREPTLNVQWSWSKIDGQPHAYEIVIDSPLSRETTHLCIDGQLAKTVPPSVSRFDWSFKSLPVGPHEVTLLVTDENGNIGIASRPVRIR